MLYYDRKQERREVETIPESKAKKEWMKEHTTFIGLKFNNRQDADILQKLEEVGNKQGYIKALIRADIEKEDSNA